MLKRKKNIQEKSDAGTESAKKWISERLPLILKEYVTERFGNTDETGLCFRTIPDRMMMFKNGLASVEKKQKDRVTIILTINFTECKKKTPLAIGKSKSLKCFTGVRNLPVQCEICVE